MLIVERTTTKRVRFDELGEGEMFLCDGRVYMKTDGLVDGASNLRRNCLNLETGKLGLVSNTNTFVPFHGKLVEE